jgi:hypothetical protein
MSTATDRGGSGPPKPSTKVRASYVFKAPAVWLPPLIFVSILIFVMTLVYSGSLVNPAGHLHALPAALVNEDAGATVGFFRFISSFESLKQILDGVRSVLYFDGRGAAGLTRSFVATALGLVFWVALGATVTMWYDRKGLDRLMPGLIGFVDQAVRGCRQQTGRPSE